MSDVEREDSELDSYDRELDKYLDHDKNINYVTPEEVDLNFKDVSCFG